MTYELPSPARAAPGIHAAPDCNENLEHLPVRDTGQRQAGDAYELAEEHGAHGKPLHFAAHGRIVEVSCAPPLATRSFFLRCGAWHALNQQIVRSCSWGLHAGLCHTSGWLAAATAGMWMAAEDSAQRVPGCG